MVPPTTPKNYFKLQILFFRILGVNLDESSISFSEKMYSVYRFLILSFFVYFYLLTEMIDLAMKWGDIDMMTFTLCYMVAHLGGLFKMTAILLQRKQIKMCYTKLESGYFLPDYKRGGTNEFQIVSEAVRRSNMQSYIFYTFVMIIISNRGLYAAFDKGYFAAVEDIHTNQTITKHYQILPYAAWLPFDTNISPYYEIAFAYQIIAITFYGLLIGTCDSFVTGFLIHIKAQLLILKNSFENYINRAIKQMQKCVYCKSATLKNVLEMLPSCLDTNTNSAFHIFKCGSQMWTGYIIISFANLAKIKMEYIGSCGVANKIEFVEKLHPKVQILIKKYLNECIIHHQEIIYLVEVAESLFNYVILFQFLCSMAVLCLSLFQLTLSEANSTRFFSMICFVTLMLFQLLIFCWNGNAIQVESLEIADAIYNSDWILCDTEMQKHLIPVIQRAQRPLQISAGKFAYLTLETYMNILRASVSYYMVLRSVNE